VSLGERHKDGVGGALKRGMHYGKRRRQFTGTL
jgi:hypothetical protein